MEHVAVDNLINPPAVRLIKSSDQQTHSIFYRNQLFSQY
ncbi:hypothetical protein MNBD_GAMMA13-2069, partial [hydrothermal vent metagenome]